MKSRLVVDGRIFGRWKFVSAIGGSLAAVGLVAGLILARPLVGVVLGQPIPDASLILHLLGVAVAGGLTIAGFLMMVVGADPFDDSEAEFSASLVEGVPERFEIEVEPSSTRTT